MASPTATPHPLLGYIVRELRNARQAQAAAEAEAQMIGFALPDQAVPAGTKVLLTDLWKDPDVVADTGFEFTGFRQLSGSCFPAGTPVRMADGSEKPVEAVAVGDEVVTHTGKARRVLNVMSRPYTGWLVTLHVSAFPFPLTMTTDHPVAILGWDGGIRWTRAGAIGPGDRVLLGWGREPTALAALDTAALLGDQALVLDELMKDNAFIPGNEPDVPVANFSSARSIVRRSCPDWHGRVKLVRSRAENAIFRHIPVSPSLGRLLGLYLAEGGCDAGRVTFSLSAEETVLAGEILALVRGLFGAEGYLERSPDRPNNLKVRFDNVNLATVFKALVPGDVYTKRVPGIFFGADEETRVALLLGWLHGDGYTGLKVKRNIEVRIQGTSVSAGLARDMTTLALSCGIRASTGRRKPRKQSRAAYDVYLSGRKVLALFPALAAAREATGAETRNRTDPGCTPYGYARPVRQVKKTRLAQTVYDFEVEEDHSFVAGGLVVHNCVGVSTGNAVFTLSAMQRKLDTGATRALLPWWPFAYARARLHGGSPNPGSGAMVSVMAQTLIREGVMPYAERGHMPDYTHEDGLALDEKTELQYSDGDAAVTTQYLNVARKFPVARATILRSTAHIKSAILHGYPVVDGCAFFVSRGELHNDVALGRYDSRGGHATCFLGFYMHRNYGPLYLYSNQWAGATYPEDQSGKGRCCVWMKEADVDVLFRAGGGGGETVAISNLTSFPVRSEVMGLLARSAPKG